MKARIADWINRRLVEQRGAFLAPPGGSQHFRMKDPTGAEITVIALGDAFDCYQGKRHFFTFSLTATTMIALAWWVIWTWWACGTWCGLKTRLWNWSLQARKLPNG